MLFHSRKWIFAAIICLFASGAMAQVPDSVFAQCVDDEFHFVNSTEMSGSLGENEGTVTWVVGDGQATVTMAGSYGFSGPDFQIAWDTTPEPFPIYISANTQTASAYIMEIKWYEGFEMEEERRTLTEDQEWGILLPGGAQVWINLFLDEYVEEHDVTFTINWGEGTPEEPATWGNLKAIYR